MPKVAKSLAQIVKESKAALKHGPVWLGPESDGPQGGITFSLLSRWLGDRERFRLHAIEGIQTNDAFNVRIEYGNMWHACEEGLAKVQPWTTDLQECCQKMSKRYPYDGNLINHWYKVCKTQFPIYIEWWKKHLDVKGRTPLLQEHTFKVPYKLPSGRVVYLRGKWDSVDSIDGGIYLQENKTKGDIKPQLMKRQLTFDLQVMTYIVALQEAIKLGKF